MFELLQAFAQSLYTCETLAQTFEIQLVGWYDIYKDVFEVWFENDVKHSCLTNQIVFCSTTIEAM